MTIEEEKELSKRGTEKEVDIKEIINGLKENKEQDDTLREEVITEDNTQEISAIATPQENENVAEVIRKRLEEHKRVEKVIAEKKVEEAVAAKKSEEVQKREAPPQTELKNSSEKAKDPRKHRVYLIILIIAITLIFLAILGAIGYFIYESLRSNTNERYLSANENIMQAVIENEKIANIILSNEIDLIKVSKISIVFSAQDNSEHPYETDYIGKEYEISASDLGLESFESITAVKVFLEYSSEPAPQTNVTSPLINQTSTKTNQSGNRTTTTGGGGGGGSSCTAKTCSDYSGQCGSLDNGCRGAITCDCDSESECISGSCTKIAECTSDINCTYLNGTCGLGFCNLTLQKCGVNYNQTTDICRVSQGICDITERCSGSLLDCPIDLFNLSTVICKENASDCDAVDYCSGNAAGCVDQNKSDGASCNGGLWICNSGKCISGCTDDNDCLADDCYSNRFLNYSCISSDCVSKDTTKEENLTNNNCLDTFDNDCDSFKDSLDSNCASPVVFPTDYIAYWKLNSQTGGITPDESGPNNGALFGDAKIINDAQRGQVLSLDGDGDYVNLSNPDALHVQNFTLCAWFKKAENNKNYGIFTDDIYGSNSQWELYIKGVGNQIALWYGPNSKNVASTTSSQSNEWYHLTGVYNGTSILIYINGSLENSSLVANPPSYSASRTTGLGVVNLDWGGSFFNGSIDDVMIYNRALSAGEVQSVYNSQSTEIIASLSPFVKFWSWIKDLLS
jgi:hypothetical protein